MKKILTILMVVLSFLSASASTQIGNLYYELDDNTRTAEVTYLSSSLSGNENYVTGSLSIPQTVQSGTVVYTVTSIGNKAFIWCSGLTSVTIPNTVIKIGNNAFDWCTGLTSVTIPSSVTEIGYGILSNCSKLTSINVNSSNASFTSENGILFSKEKKILYQYPAGKVSTSYGIPNSVTEIKGYAFEGCSMLKNVTIPSSITKISDNAFYNCKSMTSVSIPGSVTEIGRSAFSDCRGLTSVTIPNSVKTIDQDAFYNCEGLVNVVLPNSLTTISRQAFYNCGLKSVTIPRSVTYLHGGSFANCKNLISVDVNTENQKYTSVDGVVYSKDLSTLILCPTALKGDFKVPNTVNTIGDYAFYHSRLTNIEIPTSVTTIGQWAFAACSNLKTIVIPNSVKSFGTYAFYTSGVTTIYNYSPIPKNINSDVFYGKNLSTITLYVPFSSDVLYKKSKVWKEMNIKTFDAGIQDVVVEVVDDIVYIVEKNKGTAYCMGPIEENVVKNNLELKSAIDIDGVSYPVVTIINAAFQGCTGLTGSLIIPNSVKSVGEYTFDGCYNLDEVKIGNSVEGIGFGAFYNCTGLKNVIFETPSALVSIEDWAFNNCSSLTSIDLPASVTTLKYCAFYNCAGLKEITIPESVTTIGQWVFNGCKSLKNVELPNTITAIGDFAFYACSGLTKVNIPTSLQSIGNQVFANCNLSEIVIPATVNHIGSNAFGGNANLLDVYSLSTIPPTCTDGTSFSTLTKTNGKLYVPLQSIPDYQKAVCWEDFNYTTYIPVEATDIQLNKTELTIFINQEETLIVTLTPEDATSEIVWSTQDNDNVISVNQAGMVKALSVGTAKVVATADDLSATCEVTVLPVLAMSITIEGAGINTLKETETLQLTASVLPENVTYPEVSWESSDTGIATVEDNGLVTAVGVGEVDITAYLTNQPGMQAIYHLTIEKRIPGDANDNGVVNVADVVTISDVIVNKEVLNFCFVNADINYDNRITTSDLTSAVNLILEEVPSIERKAWKNRECSVTNDVLKLDDFSISSNHLSKIEARLENTNTYSALHTTILIPEGMEITEVSKGTRTKTHSLNYNIIDGKILEILLYSLSNEIIGNGEGSLFSIGFTAKEDTHDFQVQAVMASDVHSNEFELEAEGGRNITHTTAVGSFENSPVSVTTYVSGIEILNAEQSRYDVYSLAGETVVSDIAKSNLERIPLEKGIYLVVVNSKVFKVLVK